MFENILWGAVTPLLMTQHEGHVLPALQYLQSRMKPVSPETPKHETMGCLSVSERILCVLFVFELLTFLRDKVIPQVSAEENSATPILTQVTYLATDSRKRPSERVLS